MPDLNFTDITIILDTSGSMGPLARDTIGGFNNFVAEQKALPGKARLSLVQFSDRSWPTFLNRELSDVPELNHRNYSPNGNTALLDAIGRAINETGSRYGSMKDDDRPGKVIMVIQTDGEENASREYKREQIATMIEHQTTKYKWEFVFFGANQDSFLAAGELKIGAANVINFAANSKGMASSYSSLGANVSNYRSGKAATMGFTQQDRDAQAAAGAQNPTP